MRYFKNPETNEIYPVSDNFDHITGWIDNPIEISEVDIDPSMHSDTLIYGQYRGIKYAVLTRLVETAMKVRHFDFIKYVEEGIDFQLALENN
jgi:hypothetical protein